LTSNDENTNKNAEVLGDRDLAVWLGSGDGGIYAFATYSYNDLVGNGNPNVYKNVKYGEDHKKWHFIYFGYSRKERKALGFIQFEGRKEELVFNDVNHFLIRQYFIYIAKDKFYPSYNGKISNFRLTLC
jgi:hypothetical protein